MFCGVIVCFFAQVKHSVGVKNIQAEHLTKLQQKHQQDAELLEDIRSGVKLASWGRGSRRI